MKESLCILLTNITLNGFTGTELVIRDLAIGLQQRGHRPIVYTPTIGGVSTQLNAAGIPIISDLSLLVDKPDIIHGHHHIETLSASMLFPDVPVIFVCHDRTSWHDIPVYAPNVIYYVAISLGTRNRLMRYGISAERIQIIKNAVDTNRFQLRTTRLPQHPKRAILFNNDVKTSSEIRAFEQACERYNIDFSVLGYGMNNGTTHPEKVLPNYDIVFAIGKSALEALAVGCSVIPVISRQHAVGIGDIHTIQNIQAHLDRNLAQCIKRKGTVRNIVAQIKNYNPEDAEKVTHYIRQHENLDRYIQENLALYQMAIAQFHQSKNETTSILQEDIKNILLNLSQEEMNNYRYDGFHWRFWLWDEYKDKISLIQRLKRYEQMLKTNHPNSFFYQKIFLPLKQIYRKIYIVLTNW